MRITVVSSNKYITMGLLHIWILLVFLIFLLFFEAEGYKNVGIHHIPYANSGISDISQTKTNNTDFKSKQLYDNLLLVRKLCGELCDTSFTNESNYLQFTDLRYFDHLQKSTDCVALWSSHFIDAAGQFPPALQSVPDFLTGEFSYDGRVNMLPYYKDGSKSRFNPNDNKVVNYYSLL